MAIPIPLQEALRDSITSGTFVDTKFWVFSKRGPKAGRAGSPRALFVNGHVAERVPKLASLLEKRGAKDNLRTKFPTDRKPYTSDYDYEDDSDLEDDEDDDTSDSEDVDEPAVAPQAQVTTEKSASDAKLVTVENSDATSDIISVSDADSLFSEPPDTKGETNPTSSAHIGKVVVIEDVAFVTFQALLRYLYTNEIEFAPWGSAERRKARSHEIISESYGIHKPSPKSIYRLANKYDIPELKELALRQIRRDLSKCDITEEALSKYTSWYPELRELELRQLAWTLSSADSDNTLKLLKEKIKAYTHGNLPHAKHAISALYKLMESDPSPKGPPLPVTVGFNWKGTSRDWAGLKKALTTSLTSGTFLDSQFHALESRPSTSLPSIRPIYFCSAVDGNFTSKLTACSSKLRPRGSPVKSTNGYDSDIGDEDPDRENPTECYPSSKCIRENPSPSDLPMDPALMLNFGAAKTWSAVLLYVYSGQVAFTAINSQNVASKEDQNGCPGDETKSLQDRERQSASPGIITPKPCSPKSIYQVANQVGLTRLCDIAFKDIQSQLDKKNILEELFSPFTADHERVKEMEYELFQSKLKPLIEGAPLYDIIESSSSGEHPHRAAVMELILERSVQRCRKGALSEVKDIPQPDSAQSQPKTTSGAPNIPVQPRPPVPTQRLKPMSLFGSTFPSSLMMNNTSPSSSTYSQPPVKTKVTKRDETPANTKANQSPRHTVELACSRCGGKPLDSQCGTCSNYAMQCTGCRTVRVIGINGCGKCATYRED